MVRALLLASVFGLGLAASQVHADIPAMTDDPYVWLEAKDSPQALDWVKAENAKTLARLESDANFKPFFDQAYAIATAKDRIPTPGFSLDHITNFWRDEANPHGILRATTETDYLSEKPTWTTQLDLDALGKAEGKNWVYHGMECLSDKDSHCMVALSDGGEDAVSMREYDRVTNTFVAGGFSLPRSKQNVAWLDKDHLLVTRDWGAGSLTASGYPFVVKILARGQALADAHEVFKGQPSDQVESNAVVLTDGDDNRVALIQRGTTFFGHEMHVLTADGVHQLPVPARANVVGMLHGQVLIQLSEAWDFGGGAIPTGALVAVDRTTLTGGPLRPTIIFAPGPRQSLDGAAVTRNHLLLTILDNVRARTAIYDLDNGKWSHRMLDLPDNASIGVTASSTLNDVAYINVTSFIAPNTLWRLDASSGELKQVKALPARFDSAGLVVEQYQAPSSDGTPIPYFIVHRKDAPHDGKTPTLMTAYGGFEISNTPYYLGSTGKLWLERGGSFVLANIRGGGEFGPAWHTAGLKTKRQIIYDDFAGVAHDLINRGFTTPAKLGIYGGSNGGLLMGVEFSQHPDLWGAVTIQVPLLDMLRYEQIQAGASWVDEYGSVSVPAERAFLAKISPYQNIRRGVAYPEPFIWTTTKDDRVGPQHARKFAARLKEYGLPYFFYEDLAGGHSGDADVAQRSRIQALEMVYFTQHLMR